jgi:tetratricopeptide (TPR) repeat protein
MANYLARRYDAAIDQLRKTIEMEPEFARAHGNLAECYAKKGMLAEAIAEAQTAARLSGGRRPAVLAYCYALAGRKEDARRILDEIGARQQTRFVPPFYAAATSAALGDRDRAFAVLEKGIEQRAYMLRLGVDPALDPLRSDPRFASLMRRVGLP